jgi:hypothetical protein
MLAGLSAWEWILTPIQEELFCLRPDPELCRRKTRSGLTARLLRVWIADLRGFRDEGQAGVASDET